MTSLQRPNFRCLSSALSFQLSRHKKAHSQLPIVTSIRPIRSIARFNGEGVSEILHSNCNKSVITCPLGRLADLSHSGASHPRVINQPAPSWPCYNYSSHIVVKVNTKRCACVSILKCACIYVCMD